MFATSLKIAIESEHILQKSFENIDKKATKRVMQSFLLLLDDSVNRFTSTTEMLLQDIYVN